MKRIIITEEQYRQLIKEIDTQHVSKIEFEPSQINDRQFQMEVIIDGKKYPVNLIDFKIEPRNVRGRDLYQFHMFINKQMQRQGLATLVCRAFIEEYGNLYCGFGRMLNPDGINGIFKKLSQYPNITVSSLDELGIVAMLKS